MLELVLKRLFLFSVLFNGIFLNVYGFHFSAERFLAAFLLLPIIWVVVLQALDGYQLGSRPYAGGWLFGLWCVSLLFSLVLSNAPSAHINGYLISVEPAILYFLFAGGSKSGKAVATSVEAILWYLSVFGVIVYLVWSAAQPSWLAFCIYDNRLKLTIIEPNIFGATLGFFLILHFPYFQKRMRHFILYGLSLAAFVFSFSRGPYVGFIVGVLVYFIASGAFKNFRAQFALVVALALCAIFALLFWDQLSQIYATHLDRSNAIAVRTTTIQFAIARLFVNPLFGNGPLDFGLTARQIMSFINAGSTQDVWIWQMFVAIMYDSGIVGLLIYVAFLAGLLWRGYRLARSKGSRLHASYLGGFLVLFITSQSTTLHLTALYGIAAGLLGSGLPAAIRSGGSRARSVYLVHAPEHGAGANRLSASGLHKARSILQG